tara:strand:- start:300 stop:431 length:132 start_codon:yes stop_codon:yes gene_type:complete
MFEGVDKPVTLLPEDDPPQALIKLKETIIINFFINFSEYVILS